ncbi:single-stranded DNA-binding protein [Candidatus Entotheonella serta]|nr:single-stranded DNA-binding protein [Candidatus Entotheonella serta]
MASLNSVTLLGNLTRDPELRYTPQGTAVATFGLAVNRRYSQEGQQREEVCFVDIVAFGRQAETVNEYLSKGNLALVEGRLQWRSWETPEGQKRSKHEVVANNVQFMPRGSGRQSEGGYQPARSAPPSRPSAPPSTPPPMGGGGRFDDAFPPPDDDDLPF